jgi:hypothetical protein
VTQLRRNAASSILGSAMKQVVKSILDLVVQDSPPYSVRSPDPMERFKSKQFINFPDRVNANTLCSHNFEAPHYDVSMPATWRITRSRGAGAGSRIQETIFAYQP